ncbi:MAG: hypothetical protein J5634_01975 [Bacilli bacterium]|nr:hypothetical protein [Bacilli bacterium]
MLDDIIKETHDSLKLNKINDNLYLTNKEIEVLERYDINYHTSIDELMFNLEEILNESNGEYEDLEEVSNSISEFNYYHNTNK